MATVQTGAASRAIARDLSFLEFVALIASLMALTALSIDVMLPALPKIGTALNIAAANDRQAVIIVYVAGFAFGQLFFGPLSDRFGRKTPLLAGLCLYVVGSALALASSSLTGLLVARALQGLGAAGPRVIAFAIVRDKFDGRDMARVMSFVMMVFIVVPILAPAIGEGVLQVAEWRAIFFFLLSAAIGLATWVWLRLEETRHPEDRQQLSIRELAEGFRHVLSTRQTVGYVITTGFVFGLLMSYITSAEQIFVDVYKLGDLFPLAFAAIASFLVGAAIVNASIVRTVGMRRVSQTALACLVVICAGLAALGFPAQPPLLAFCAFMGAIFFGFGLMMPNFNALAMEPMGRIAGMASSIAGFYSTAAGAVFAAIIGRSFDGTVRPLMIGMSILIAATVASVLITERFRLHLSKASANKLQL